MSEVQTHNRKAQTHHCANYKRQICSDKIIIVLFLAVKGFLSMDSDAILVHIFSLFCLLLLQLAIVKNFILSEQLCMKKLVRFGGFTEYCVLSAKTT